jgi:hypothetical protein
MTNSLMPKASSGLALEAAGADEETAPGARLKASQRACRNVEGRKKQGTYRRRPVEALLEAATADCNCEHRKKALSGLMCS